MGKIEYHEWQRFAVDDLEAAQYLLTMPRRKLEIICYHCQQCAEKTMKSLLAWWDLEIPHTHDLRILANALRDVYSFTEVVEHLIFLQPFAVAVRYPYEIELIPGDEDHAILAATVIHSLCLKLAV